MYASLACIFGAEVAVTTASQSFSDGVTLPSFGSLSSLGSQEVVQTAQADLMAFATSFPTAGILTHVPTPQPTPQPSPGPTLGPSPAPTPDPTPVDSIISQK